MVTCALELCCPAISSGHDQGSCMCVSAGYPLVCSVLDMLLHTHLGHCKWRAFDSICSYLRVFLENAVARFHPLICKLSKNMTGLQT